MLCELFLKNRSSVVYKSFRRDQRNRKESKTRKTKFKDTIEDKIYCAGFNGTILQNKKKKVVDVI